jgi:hypothetical protein
VLRVEPKTKPATSKSVPRVAAAGAIRPESEPQLANTKDSRTSATQCAAEATVERRAADRVREHDPFAPWRAADRSCRKLRQSLSNLDNVHSNLGNAALWQPSGR